MIKVGFDISQIIHPGGVASYTKNLAQNLQKEKDLEMVFFFSSLRKRYKGDLKNVKKFRLPPSLFEVLFNRIRNVGIEKFIGSVDIFHSSDWVQPPSKTKKVTTYHDVIPLKFPKWSNPKIVSVHKRRLKIIEEEIDKVIAVSENTKKDLMEVSGIPEDKIVVIYEGVGENFKPQSEDKIREFRKKYKLPDKFVLATGGIGERKNIKRIKDSCMGFNLVISGQTMPILTDEEMPLLYASARLLLYPTLYEGFGLPVLEAMACGTPVVTSQTSSIPEVAGKAALFADPESVVDIQKKLKQAFEDEEKREALIKEGIKQASKFTWKKTSDQTSKVYEDLMKK